MQSIDPGASFEGGCGTVITEEPIRCGTPGMLAFGTHGYGIVEWQVFPPLTDGRDRLRPRLAQVQKKKGKKQGSAEHDPKCSKKRPLADRIALEWLE